MCNDGMGTVVVQVDADLVEQLTQIITPMGLTPEMLIVRFFEWCVSPETKDEAKAWLLKHKEDMC